MQRPVSLACDGGQSGLRVIAFTADAEGRPLVEAQAAVDGFSWARGGDPVAQQADRVIAAWRAVGAPAAVNVLAIGLSAGGSFSADRVRLCGILGESLPVNEIRSTGDDVVTHLGALSGASGVALAAGTGTLCLAIGPAGERRNVDGLGYLFGDEGGGFWIGRAGIRAAVRAAEGRGPRTVLQDALRSVVGPLPSSVKHLYGSPTLVADVAAFAAAVGGAADDGDDVAAWICRAAADGLVGDVSAALDFLAGDDGVLPRSVAQVSVGGGVLRAGGVVRAAFADLMARRHPDVALREPAGDASRGAVLLAGTTRFVHHDMAVTWRRGPGIVAKGSPDQVGG
ncbi:MAG TPA: BadF/BadG/BcrA/BcrD ATPase family protein [Actinopolymorphaceae bacterium]